MKALALASLATWQLALRGNPAESSWHGRLAILNPTIYIFLLMGEGGDVMCKQLRMPCSPLSIWNYTDGKSKADHCKMLQLDLAEVFFSDCVRICRIH